MELNKCVLKKKLCSQIVNILSRSPLNSKHYVYSKSFIYTGIVFVLYAYVINPFLETKRT